MADGTNIQWTDATWNPIRGCSRVSEGCRNCYAEVVAARFSGPGQPYEGLTRDGRWNGQTKFVEAKLLDPIRWQRPRRVFANSMTDLFHESLSAQEIASVFAVMAEASRHTFQLLTKRPKRMRALLSDDAFWTLVRLAAARGIGGRAFGVPHATVETPLPNVWLGVSVENSKARDERTEDLLATSAAIRFLSVEPLLEPILLWLRQGICEEHGPGPTNDGTRRLSYRPACWCPQCGWAYKRERGIDWVIVGGESGPGARRCDVPWIRSIVEQCRAARVPVFVKQLGSKPRVYGHELPIPRTTTREERKLDLFETNLRDKKGGDSSEWPKDLRVRESPAV